MKKTFLPGLENNDFAENLDVGTYNVEIDVTEEGDPWENTRTVKMKLIVEELVEESTE